MLTHLHEVHSSCWYFVSNCNTVTGAEYKLTYYIEIELLK